MLRETPGDDADDDDFIVLTLPPTTVASPLPRPMPLPTPPRPGDRPGDDETDADEEAENENAAVVLAGLIDTVDDCDGDEDKEDVVFSDRDSIGASASSLTSGKVEEEEFSILALREAGFVTCLSFCP